MVDQDPPAVEIIDAKGLFDEIHRTRGFTSQQDELGAQGQEDRKRSN